MSHDQVETAIISLLKNEPFYGQFLIQMEKVYTDKIPTLGVSVTDHIKLYINSDFFNAHDLDFQKDVLKHECLHVMHLHTMRKKDKHHELWNIACDMAINENLEHILKMEGAATVENVRKGNKELKHILNKMHSEYYYEEIVKNIPGLKQALTDSHAGWEESSKDAMAKEIVKNAVKKAEKAAGAGNISSDVALLIEKLFNSKINWKTVLRQFVHKSISYSKVQSRKRRNRRYGILYAGKKKNYKSHLAIGVDTSGSVSDEQLIQFFSEINKMYTNETKLTIIEADSEIKQVYDYDPKKPVKVTGRGGTAYQPVLDKALELEVDGLIYFGDMDCFDKPKKPVYPVLWAIVGQQTPPADFGKTIYIEMDKKDE